jgi:GH15 family glucan-1,4-alpha-glucosidase
MLSMSLGSVQACLADQNVATDQNPASKQNPAPAQNSANSKIQTRWPLATGNGYGFAVVNENGDITRLYAHPYRFMKPNADQTKDGPDTVNFVQSMRWHCDSTQKPGQSTSYLEHSQIIRSKSSQGESTFFMPFGLKSNTLIAFHNASKTEARASLHPIWQQSIESQEIKDLGGVKVHLLKFKNVDELLAIVPLDKSASITESIDELPGNGWAFIVLEDPSKIKDSVQELLRWQGNNDPNTLIKREMKELNAWRVEPKIHFQSSNEKSLWLQNETILRMAQIQESNSNVRANHGLILASLPDGMWFTPWVRDMAYALVGLVRMGHTNEAREGILSWFNARPVGRWKDETRGLDYQISVTRYYGDGSEESDYSGKSTPNVEFDDWGLALWAISEYFDLTHDETLLSTKTYRGDTVYESMRDFVVKPLLSNLDKYNGGLIVAEDSSCWEEHQENKRHYACSTIAAIPGLQGFLRIAEQMHDDESVKLLHQKLPLLKKGFDEAFVKDGYVRGVVEVETQPKSQFDGAVFEAFNLGILDDPKIAFKTIDQLQKLKTASGGYRRNTGPGNYESHEFLLIDFNLARVFYRFGKPAQAATILNTLVDKSCQDNGLIPELYVSEKNKDWSGAIGDPAGSVPMVGFGAGVYAITLSEREKLTTH